MSRARLALASLRFYWRTNLGVAAGAMIGTAVLVGPRKSFRDPGETWAELDLEPGETRTIEVK